MEAEGGEVELDKLRDPWVRYRGHRENMNKHTQREMEKKKQLDIFTSFIPKQYSQTQTQLRAWVHSSTLK